MKNPVEAQRQFEAALIRAAGVGLVAGGGLLMWRMELGGGFLLGLSAGLVAYLWLARTLPKLADVPVEHLTIYSVRQAMGRLGLYAVAFALAYRLDTEHNTGLLGALGGYLFLRVAIMVNAWHTSRSA